MMADRPALTGAERHLYSVGHFAVSFMGMALTQWVGKFYAPGDPRAALVPMALAPWMLAIGRLTDGLNDPVIGWLSDKLRTRWGRRKPLMALGWPLACACFVLVWHPPAADASVSNFWWCTSLLVLFFVAFTTYTGPYLALLPEVASDAKERVRLSALQGIYNVVGLIAGGFVYALCLRPLGYQGTGWLVAGICAIAYALPLLGPSDDPRRVSGQVTPPLVESVVLTLRNRAFRIYVVSKLLFMFGLLFVVAALPYLVEELLGAHESEAGAQTGLALASAALCVPLILRRARQRGLKATYMFAMLWFAAAAFTFPLLAVFGAYGYGVWAARALLVLAGIGVGGLFALPYAVLAEVTDYDRVLTGHDRQGVFFCVQGLILKVAYSVAPWLLLGLLAWLPSHVFTTMVLVGPIAGVAALLAYAVFGRYPDAEVRTRLSTAS